MRRALAAGSVALVVASSFAACGMSTSAVPTVPFEQELRIPELAPSTVEDGVRTFEFTARAGETAFPGHETATETWGFDGDFLGPP